MILLISVVQVNSVSWKPDLICFEWFIVRSPEFLNDIAVKNKIYTEELLKAMYSKTPL